MRRRLSALATCLLLGACIPQVDSPRRAPPPPRYPAPSPRVQPRQPLGERVQQLPAPRPAWEIRGAAADAHYVAAQTWVMRPGDTLSQRYADTGLGDEVSFAAAEGWGERVLRPLLGREWTPGTVINVNFPPVPADAVKGVKVVRQGMRDYGRARLEPRTDPRGFPYYWLSLGRTEHALVPGTDLAAVADGYVTVTPLHLDLTHDASLQALANAYL